ncbi:MAG: hypothetical protein ACU826_09115 [Gammaproteobacteria bacterium]
MSPESRRRQTGWIISPEVAVHFEAVAFDRSHPRVERLSLANMFLDAARSAIALRKLGRLRLRALDEGRHFLNFSPAILFGFCGMGVSCGSDPRSRYAGVVRGMLVEQFTHVAAAFSAIPCDTEAMNQLLVRAGAVFNRGFDLFVGYGFTYADIHRKDSRFLRYINDNDSHYFVKFFFVRGPVNIKSAGLAVAVRIN